MSAVTDAYLATTPLRYWPLDETSGTNANELVANEDGTMVGGVMGGDDALASIGGKSPLFTGTEHLVARAAKILGGDANFSIGAWVKFNPGDASMRTWYGESSPTTGNDRIQAAVIDPTSASMRFLYGDDANAPTTLSANAIFITGGWVFMVVTRNGATVEQWWNVGRRNLHTTAVASSTWTDASIASWIGGVPRTGQAKWKGSISHFALWDRVLSKADQKSIYEVCTPLTRDLPTRKFFRDNAVWNQSLTTPGNEPTITADSATVVTRLANQATTYTGAANSSSGPFFEVDASTPREAVRIFGGTNNVASNPPDFYNAMQDVPIPANFSIPTVSDREGQLYADDTDELWEFFLMEKTLLRPRNLFGTLVAGGSLAIGLQVYAVMGALADDTYGLWSFYVATTTAANRTVHMVWEEIEDAHHYRIMRLTLGGVLPWGDLTTVPAGTLSYTDTGAQAWTVRPDITTQAPTAVTPDWGCEYGGHLEDTDNNVGIYPPLHYNWGSSATSLPLWAGSISIHEGRTGVIDHALALGLPEILVTGHVYPAQRNDGWFTGGNGIMEGTRFQLDPDYDINTISGSFEKAVAAALQEYGGYVRDVTNEVSVYIEDQHGYGRDMWTEVFEGRYEYETMGSFPWASCRVIDPDWTLEQTTVTTGTVLQLETLIDEFTDGFDEDVWIVGAATVIDGQARLVVNGSYVGSLNSVEVFELTGSSIYVRVPQVPEGDVGDEAALKLFTDGDPNCYVEMIYSGGELIADYNTSALVRTQVDDAVYNPFGHAWWRIREDSGTVFWETSADSQDWTELGSLVWSTSGWAASKLDTVRVAFFAGNWSGLGSRPEFVIDNINVEGVALTDPPRINLPTVLTVQERLTAMVIDGD